MIRLFFIALFAAGVAFASLPVAAQQKLPTAAEVLAKLKEKRDSGRIQRFKLEFDQTFYEGGRKVMSCRVVKNEFLIDWHSGHFRLAGWDGCAIKPFEQIEVYNGERIKTQHRAVTKEGTPDGDGSWEYGLNTGSLNSRVFKAEYWPVFFHKGVIAGLDDHFYPGHFVFDPDLDKFFIDGEVVKDGAKVHLT